MINKNDPLIEVARKILNEVKVGDIVKIPAADLVFDYEPVDTHGFFGDSFDPQDGAGGWDPFKDSIAQKETDKWFSKNKDYKGEKMEQSGHQLDYFLAKTPELAQLRIDNGKWLSDFKKAAINKFPIAGKVRPKEKYKFIIDQKTFNSFPEGTIGSAEYDYSFHAGEGIVTSWIIAIGKDKSEVTRKLKSAIAKTKAQYVGSEIELKYAQKNSVRGFEA